MFIAAVLGVVLSACGTRTNRVVDEEKEPYYLKGQEYLRQLNHEDAIGAFHQALEVNPRSSAAHKELGILYEKHENDPAASIYHYRRFLKLNPDSPIAKDIADRVSGCQIDLVEEMKDSGAHERRQRELADLKGKLTHFAQQFEKARHENDPAASIYHYRRFLKLNPESPIAKDIADRVSGCQIDLVEEMKDSGAHERRQRELADLKGKLTHLAQKYEKARYENDVLRQRLRAINPRLAKVTPPPTPTGPQKSPVAKTKAPPRPPPPPSQRRHKVKPKENPTSIARKYAIPVKRLMAANPGVDPRRMRVGQMLKIPAVQP